MKIVKNLLKIIFKKYYISQGLTPNHPRVRYVILSAFDLILKETSPLIQQKYSNNILPALDLLMGEKENSIKNSIL